MDRSETELERLFLKLDGLLNSTDIPPKPTIEPPHPEVKEVARDIGGEVIRELTDNIAQKIENMGVSERKKAVKSLVDKSAEKLVHREVLSSKTDEKDTVLKVLMTMFDKSQESQEVISKNCKDMAAYLSDLNQTKKRWSCTVGRSSNGMIETINIEEV